MSDGTEREMTLAEWVGKLPTIHFAHREYVGLMAECERLKAHLQSIGDIVSGETRLTDPAEIVPAVAALWGENAQLRADLKASKACIGWDKDAAYVTATRCTATRDELLLMPIETWERREAKWEKLREWAEPIEGEDEQSGQFASQLREQMRQLATKGQR